MLLATPLLSPGPESENIQGATPQPSPQASGPTLATSVDQPSSIDLVLLSSPDTRLGKEKPCSFPWDFPSHFTTGFWALVLHVSSFSPPTKPDCYKDSVTGLHLKAIHEASETCAKIQCTLLIGNKRIVFHFTTQLNPKASSCLESHPLCSSPFCWWQFTNLKKSTQWNKANSGGTLTI